MSTGVIRVKGTKENDHGVCLITNRMVGDLPCKLQEALVQSWGHWNDTQYLARIIFCEMVVGSVDRLTGFGISSLPWDVEYQLIDVNPDKQTVSIEGQAWSFEDFSCLTGDIIGPLWAGSEW